MGWLDGVRGVAMLLVVWHHFMIGAFKGMATGVVETLTSFEVPLFFFVSGFFAWKGLSRPGGPGARGLWRKGRTLIGGMLVFYVLWQLRNGEGVLDFLTDGFRGYWFTWALFQMFVVSMAWMWVTRRSGRESTAWWGLGLTAAVGLGAVTVGGKVLVEARVAEVMAWYQVFNCFQYYVLGMAARRWQPGLERVLSWRWTAAVATGCFVAVAAVCEWEGLPYGAYRMLHGVAMRYCGVAMVVSVFYRARGVAESGWGAARWLRLVGRRTIDIYFMHYFLLPLPSTLPQAAAMVSDMAGGSAAIAVLIGVTGTAGIASVCAGVGTLVRRNRRLGAWLLGA